MVATGRPSPVDLPYSDLPSVARSGGAPCSGLGYSAPQRRRAPYLQWSTAATYPIVDLPYTEPAPYFNPHSPKCQSTYPILGLPYSGLPCSGLPCSAPRRRRAPQAGPTLRFNSYFPKSGSAYPVLSASALASRPTLRLALYGNLYFLRSSRPALYSFACPTLNPPHTFTRTFRSRMLYLSALPFTYSGSLPYSPTYPIPQLTP